jgi:hypothetical protein
MLNRLCSAHFSSRVLSCEKKKMDCLSVDFSSSEAHSLPPVAPSTPFSIIFPWHTHRPPATPTGRAFIFRFPTVSVSANPSLSNSVHSLNPSAASGGLRWGNAPHFRRPLRLPLSLGCLGTVASISSLAAEMWRCRLAPRTPRQIGSGDQSSAPQDSQPSYHISFGYPPSRGGLPCITEYDPCACRPRMQESAGHLEEGRVGEATYKVLI